MSLVSCFMHTTQVTLPKTRQSSEIDEKMRRKPSREAAKTPSATLKELHEFLAYTGCLGHATAFFHFYMSEGGRTDVLERKTSKPSYILQKQTWNVSKKFGKMCYGPMKPKLNFLVIIPKMWFGANTAPSPKQYHTNMQVWWWQQQRDFFFFVCVRTKPSGLCYKVKSVRKSLLEHLHLICDSSEAF